MYDSFKSNIKFALDCLIILTFKNNIQIIPFTTTCYIRINLNSVLHLPLTDGPLQIRFHNIQ